ncbi:MAG: hypothetical protein COA94_08070 [Rickettsiales bacterium]|nr:MAG: hypothetical protein COA94_08070 [Rickettsiales bacterium]
MKYFIQGRFRGLVEQKRGKDKEYTFYYVVLESEQNITLIKQIQYNPEKFQIDEDSFKGQTVLCPVYIDHVHKKSDSGDVKTFENIKLIDEIKVV